MTIKEKGYSHWEGELVEKKFPWWPITRFGIHSTFRKKFFKIFFFGSLMPAVVFLVGIYISERLEDFRFMIQQQENFLTVDPGYFKSYFTGDFLLFMMVMILVFCGAGLISDDLKHNSLQLYFSRPLKKGQYFLGKASVVFFFLFMVTLVPGLVFFIMKLIFSGSLKFFASYPWLPLSIIGYSFLVTLFFALYTLFLSSLSKNRRYVAILIFAVYFFSDIIFNIFYGIFRNQYFALISLKANLKQIGAFLFNQKLPYSIPWIYSFLIIFSISLLAAVYLRKKVKEVTIIK
jgi:ABC-type transport system involved in multi-copper enzyme maturation permease subunit